MIDINSIPYDILEACSFNELTAYILYRRGFKDPTTIREFLDPGLYKPTDPFEFEDMDMAVERINRAIHDGEKILVYGDYDVDGITSASILYLTLKSLGADVICHLPDRFSEGYGMSIDVIHNLPGQGVKLIITCDCGIGNLREIAYANSLGIETIVTDHHTPPDVLPDALYLLNPKFFPEDHPARNIAGAGMAYFLSRALIHDEADGFLDLVSLGTIADSVPVNLENRYLLQKGWDSLISGKRPGLAALFQVSHLKGDITEEDIAFQIVPRLNSAGRMDTAILSFKLLTEDNINTCLNLAKTLDRLNSDRKKVQDEILSAAEKEIENNRLYKDGIIALYNPTWHQGVIGIAAGRITEEYGLPSLLMTKNRDGNIVGSARSIDGVSIYNILSGCSDSLLGFGGHTMAAGFSLKEEKLGDFLDKLRSYGGDIQRVKSASSEPELELFPEEINQDLYNAIRGLAPFGEGFPEPVFITRCLEVIDDSYQNFHRLIIGLDGKRLHALWWNGPRKKLEPGYYDVLYTVNMDRYRDIISLTIENIEKSMETARPKIVPELIDMKDKPIEEVLKMEGSFYCEGTANAREETCTRYTLPQSERLIILSAPPSPGILRDIVLISNPKEVILSFAADSILRPDDVLKKIMGAVKYAEDRGRIVDIQYLSSRIGITEMAALNGLMLLNSMGLIELEEINKLKYYVVTKNDKKKEDKQLKKRFIDLIGEMNSFMAWLKKAGIDEIKDLIK